NYSNKELENKIDNLESEVRALKRESRNTNMRENSERLNERFNKRKHDDPDLTEWNGTVKPYKSKRR
ncbi:MAG: hypothetical protein VYC84_01205, partial [Candidatus Neomarinimicrobiota bacterium]|nr:hypothetical protein [Candidatus Neomarinimicrobiota bacterium]